MQLSVAQSKFTGHLLDLIWQFLSLAVKSLDRLTEAAQLQSPFGLYVLITLFESVLSSCWIRILTTGQEC